LTSKSLKNSQYEHKQGKNDKTDVFGTYITFNSLEFELKYD